SISQPHIHAFPGVEWSRSIAEAVRYMRARVLPGAGVVEIRRAYGGQQSLDVDAPWVRMSQLQRIVSWLGGRRTRVDTLACVRGAWALENKPDARSASPRAPEPAPMSIDAARRWSETVWAEAQAAGPGEV